MIIIRNSKIENFLILDESKLFIFNRSRMRFTIVRSNYDKIFIILLIFLRETH